jgi:hypothetical protein
MPFVDLPLGSLARATPEVHQTLAEQPPTHAPSLAAAAADAGGGGRACPSKAEGD